MSRRGLRAPTDSGHSSVPDQIERVLTIHEPLSVPLIDRLRRATVGRYDVYAELGAGGMATVYLALDLALDRMVAIKVMSPALLSSAGAVDRFRREARVAAALSHPHIVPIHAIGEEAGLAFYVMKHIAGTSLDTVLRFEGRQRLAFARVILGHVGDALDYAHTRGVVHRDVKPANVMLDREGWCYVTDFGIAKFDDGAGLTKSGAIIGTPHYMCPEQFNGLPISGAADQYSLGIVAYELITGRPPFGGPTVGEVMRGHLLDPIPLIAAVRTDVPESMAAAVERMLSKDPADRFPSVGEAIDAFGRASAVEQRETRALIAELAARGAELNPTASEPTSPLPQRRMTVHAGAANAPTTPIATPAPVVQMRRRSSLRRRIEWSIVTVAIGVAGYVGLYGTGGGTAAAAPPAVPAPDSVIAPRPDSTPRRAALATPAPTPTLSPRELVTTPPPATAVPGDAWIRIGSRIPLTVLYVNDIARDVIGAKGLQLVTVRSGRVRLSLRAENCVNWDTSFVASASDTISIGNRGPRC